MRKEGLTHLPPLERALEIREITFEAPVHYSNVALIDPVTDLPTKTRWLSLLNEEKGKSEKVRVSTGPTGSNSVIEIPRDEVEMQELKRRQLAAQKPGPLDTRTREVQERTLREQHEIPKVCARIHPGVRKLLKPNGL